MFSDSPSLHVSGLLHPPWSSQSPGQRPHFGMEADLLDVCFPDQLQVCVVSKIIWDAMECICYVACTQMNHTEYCTDDVFCFQPVEATDDAFWDQFWADTATSVQDVFALVPAAEIRAVREESPSNLATLCYKVATLSAKINSCMSRDFKCNM